MSLHRCFGADGWRFYPFRCKSTTFFWIMQGNKKETCCDMSIKSLLCGGIKYRWCIGKDSVKSRWSPYEVPMKFLWSPYAYRGQSKGIQKESPRGCRRDITMCDKEIVTSKAKIILLIYNSICFARISSSRKREAESENLVADSVVRNLEFWILNLELSSRACLFFNARSAMSEWRSK